MQPILTTTQQIGHTAEKYAAQYLQQNGLTLLTMNYRCQFGEIDLIMQQQQRWLIFVEVRVRNNLTYGDGVSSVTRSKQEKIIKTARCYLQRQHLVDKCYCRFDIIAITTATTPLKLQWIQDAFWQQW